MARCRHHSGYLADDEAVHPTYMTRMQPPKKPLFSEMGPASKLGRVPHPPSTYGSSALPGHSRNERCPQPFGNFLDFLTESQVLDSLQMVVEKATERIATMKTRAGVPLVEVQDPVEVPSGGRRAHARPSLRAVHRHRVLPSLCTGRLNNYPSRSSSKSDSHSRDSDLGAHSLGSLPPVKDKLLLEKTLKRLQQLENKGKGLSQSCSQRDSLLWDTLGSQTSSQWTWEQPQSLFSGLLGSESSIPAVSELEPGERELVFLKREFNKEIKSLLSQPASFDLPGYCAFHEPHRTLDFLAKHNLLSALQSVVSQAVDKLKGARRRDGCPLFPANFEPAPELPVHFDLLLPDFKPDTATKKEEPHDSPLTTASNPKASNGKIKSTQGSPPVSSVPVTTRLGLKSPSSKFTKKSPPSLSTKSSMSHFSKPWHEELLTFLAQQAVSLLICKYKFEKDLNKQLGFISFPITETLVDLFLGFKKVKGSSIHLSSDINWSCLLRKLEEAERTGHASQLSASHRSAEMPPMQPEPATNTDQNQTMEPCRSFFSNWLVSQPFSPQESLMTEDQTLTNPLEPKFSVSSGIVMGSSLQKSKEAVNIEDSEGNDEVEIEIEDEDEVEDENENKSESQSLPEPGVEAWDLRSVDMDYSDFV
ncbi:coiled-coil domain-containing protein 116 [Carlito syrichta]|uniref:Coiled-coil domain-containing protein 116 n=1 Tax=Carlito syrichta TaxID=1868482 RepID=A0A1U7UI10_CARSF|nr:coiled-coil domain-containing protein 116 [Carlito syrichta]